MRPIGFILAVVVVGCAGTAPPIATSQAPSATLCEPEVPFEGAPPGCWQGQLPVRPCDDPAHPELVGLWGQVEDGVWRPRLLYDGCCVTLEDLVVSPTLDMMVEAGQRGGPTNVGLAWRTQAAWEGDRLLSLSHLASPSRTVGRRVGAEDGSTGLAFIHEFYPDPGPHPLQRHNPSACIDGHSRDMLCARRVASGGASVSRHICRDR